MKAYERDYYRTEAVAAASEGAAACGNCGQAVAAKAGEARTPMCGVCWGLLEASVRTAQARGFRIG